MPGPGTALWNELATDSLDASKDFYARVLGWAFDDMPMPDGTYTIAKAGDEQAAGLMKLPMEGMKSLWVPYFHVPDADAAAAAVAEAGGQVISPINDVPNVGRIFWAVDPGGATVGIMTPAEAMGDG